MHVEVWLLLEPWLAQLSSGRPGGGGNRFGSIHGGSGLHLWPLPDGSPRLPPELSGLLLDLLPLRLHLGELSVHRGDVVGELRGAEVEKISKC